MLNKKSSCYQGIDHQIYMRKPSGKWQVIIKKPYNCLYRYKLLGIQIITDRQVGLGYQVCKTTIIEKYNYSNCWHKEKKILN